MSWVFCDPLISLFIVYFNVMLPKSNEGLIISLL